MATIPPKATARTIEIELLALDLTTCGRCTRTERNLTDAIAAVAGALQATGAEVRITKHVVHTAEQAERLHFVASPTIRMDGRDIALDFKESSCSDCSDRCGCNGGVDCRVWIWRGEEYLEAPRAMIADALIKAYASDPVDVDHGDYRLPDNLQRYFASRAARASGSMAAAAEVNDCCDHRAACCEVADAVPCCGSEPSIAEPVVAAPQTCACR